MTQQTPPSTAPAQPTVQTQIQLTAYQPGTQAPLSDTQWEALQTALTRTLEKAGLILSAASHEQVAVRTPTVRAISAEVTTSSGDTVFFDATAYFEQSGKDDLQDLIDENFEAGAATDTVAVFMADYLPPVYNLLRTQNARKGGYTCVINESDALAWIREHRPVFTSS